MSLTLYRKLINSLCDDYPQHERQLIACLSMYNNGVQLTKIEIGKFFENNVIELVGVTVFEEVLACAEKDMRETYEQTLQANRNKKPKQ